MLNLFRTPVTGFIALLAAVGTIAAPLQIPLAQADTLVGFEMLPLNHPCAFELSQSEDYKNYLTQLRQIMSEGKMSPQGYALLRKNIEKNAYFSEDFLGQLDLDRPAVVQQLATTIKRPEMTQMIDAFFAQFIEAGTKTQLSDARVGNWITGVALGGGLAFAMLDGLFAITQLTNTGSAALDLKISAAIQVIALVAISWMGKNQIEKKMLASYQKIASLNFDAFVKLMTLGELEVFKMTIDKILMLMPDLVSERTIYALNQAKIYAKLRSLDTQVSQRIEQLGLVRSATDERSGQMAVSPKQI